MGNGAKAKQKQERNAKDGKGEAKSQLASNAAAMDKKCMCTKTFLTTTTKKGLDEHAATHGKTGPEAFGAATYEAARDGKEKK